MLFFTRKRAFANFVLRRGAFNKCLFSLSYNQTKSIKNNIFLFSFLIHKRDYISKYLFLITYLYNMYQNIYFLVPFMLIFFVMKLNMLLKAKLLAKKLRQKTKLFSTIAKCTPTLHLF